MNKPRGVVVTRDDPQRRPTVYVLLGTRVSEPVVPVGRLDFDSEGLILLTNDGPLAFRIAHPSGGCRKEYEVKVSGVPTPAKIAKLARGILIDGVRTHPATVELIDTTPEKNGVGGNAWLRVILGEGRSRQVRKMLEAVGHKVSKLRRVAIGPLRDKSLPPGGFRDLAPAEVAALRALEPAPKKASTPLPGGTSPKARANPAPSPRATCARGRHRARLRPRARRRPRRRIDAATRRGEELKPSPRPSVQKLAPYVPGRPIEDVEREFGIAGAVKLASNENPLGPVAEGGRRGPGGHAVRAPLPGRLRDLPPPRALGAPRRSRGADRPRVRLLRAHRHLHPHLRRPGRGGRRPGRDLPDVPGRGRARRGDVRRGPDEGRATSPTSTRSCAASVPPRSSSPSPTRTTRPALTFPGPTSTASSPGCPGTSSPSSTRRTSSSLSETPDYPDALDYLRAGHNVAVLRTFSKIYGLAGLRIGYAFAAPDIAAAMNKVREPFNTTSVAQAAADRGPHRRRAPREDAGTRAGGAGVPGRRAREAGGRRSPVARELPPRGAADPVRTDRARVRPAGRHPPTDGGMGLSSRLPAFGRTARREPPLPRRLRRAPRGGPARPDRRRLGLRG